MSEDLRYPIGEFNKDFEMTPELRREFIDTIAACPAGVRKAVEGLSDEQLDTPYRPGGWTVRQTVHHIPDSHLNSYCRFKLALTEDNPDHSPILRGPLGGTGRQQNAGRCFAGPAR